MKRKVALFLDFDGVFHHFFPNPEKTPEENKHFYYLKNFEKTIREFRNLLDITIVISSSWRKTRSVEELKSFFSNDIQPLIIDKTPVIADDKREVEVMSWIAINNYSGFWIALDDCDFLFSTKSNLVHCYDKFDQRESEILKIKFAEILYSY